MAKITLYLPDELNKRIKKAGLKSKINISALLREVLEKEIRRIELMKEIEKNAGNTVARLKASKEEYEEKMYDWSYQEGFNCGKKFAENVAEYQDLIKLSKMDEVSWADLTDVEGLWGDWVITWLEEIRQRSDETLTDGFLEGVLDAVKKVWDEVQDKL